MTDPYLGSLSALGSLMLALAFGYLHVRHRERFMLLWTASFAALALTVPIRVAFGDTSDPTAAAVLAVTGVVPPLLLLYGTYDFIDRRFPRWPAVLASASIIVSVVGLVAGWPLYASIGLAFTIPAVAYTLTGVELLRERRTLGDWAVVTAAGFLLRGARALAAPFIFQHSELAQLNSVSNVALLMWIAGGMLITYYERTHAGLQTGEERFSLLAEAGSDIIMQRRLFPAPAWEYVSPTVERVLGYSAQDFYDDPHIADRLLPADDLEQLRQLAVNGFPGGTTLTLRWLSADGRTVWMEHNLSPLRDPDGAAAGFQGVARDVTERKLAEDEIRGLNVELEARVQERTAEVQSVNEELAATNEELRAVNDELSASNEELAAVNDDLAQATRAKADLMSNVSHELRTPLNSIIGFSGILAQGLAGELNAEQRRQVDMIRVSGEHLLALVNDLLDMSRIEAGAVSLTPRAFDAAEGVKAACELMKPLAQQRGLTLVCDPRGPVPVYADPVRFEQIVLNLLSNALKFTDVGGVTVAVKATDDAAMVTVTDTGCGMSADQIALVFDEFVQVHTTERGKPGGTGLGLAISRRLAEMMGGGIRVESALGKGSTFAVWLPREGPDSGG